MFLTGSLDFLLNLARSWLGLLGFWHMHAGLFAVWDRSSVPAALRFSRYRVTARMCKCALMRLCQQGHAPCIGETISRYRIAPYRKSPLVDSAIHKTPSGLRVPPCVQTISVKGEKLGGQGWFLLPTGGGFCCLPELHFHLDVVHHRRAPTQELAKRQGTPLYSAVYRPVRWPTRQRCG